MKTMIKISVLIIGIVLLTNFSCNSHKTSSYVDPDIGGVSQILQPTRPTVQLPNQMIRMSPGRRDYLDDQIRSFSLSRESFSLMPFTGSLTSGIPISVWDEQLEISAPYYFSTWLEDYNITVEFTPGRKCGYFRFTFPDNTVKNIFLNIINREYIQLSASRELIVESLSRGMKTFVYGQFNEMPALNDTSSSKIRGRYISWPASSPNVIELKYAVSFISLGNAQNCSETNKYIQKALLNGNPLNEPWFTHADLMKGGELKLKMGPLPNKSWGIESDSIQRLIQTYSIN